MKIGKEAQWYIVQHLHCTTILTTLIISDVTLYIGLCHSHASQRFNAGVQMT